MSRQSTGSPSISDVSHGKWQPTVCATISNASTFAGSVFSSGYGSESVSSSTPPLTPRTSTSHADEAAFHATLSEPWSTASSTSATPDSSSLKYASSNTFSSSPPSSSFDTAAASLKILDAPFPKNLVVRNTFLDFANDSEEISVRRRARSAEPLRNKTTLSDDMPACTSISNVGVGGESSGFVPYPVGKLGAEHIPQANVGAHTKGVQQFEPVTVQLPSVGSGAHFLGQCVPCGFFWKTRGCENGSKCEYCHLCDAREKKRRQKAKKAFFKAQAQATTQE